MCLRLKMFRRSMCRRSSYLTMLKSLLDVDKLFCVIAVIICTIIYDCKTLELLRLCCYVSVFKHFMSLLVWCFARIFLW